MLLKCGFSNSIFFAKKRGKLVSLMKETLVNLLTVIARLESPPDIFSRIFSSQSHYTITFKNYITGCRRTCSKLFEEEVILWFWDLNFTFCHSISIFEHTAHLSYTQRILILLFTMYVMYIYLYLQYMNNNSYQYSNGINHLLFTY